ncbi:cyclophilin 40 isoform X2 [Rhynchophorus ferrugineus]|uniref:cyclophilin 40 isoform X2 n=1 Tax=Rhynchophorus ferrugineus TaxID=354439 RepID=UPI003FCE648D
MLCQNQQKIFGPFVRGKGAWGGCINLCIIKAQESIKHEKPGLVGVINNGPNRNSSQFYITTVPCYHLDNTNVVIGEVVKGLDIIVEMSDIPRQNDIPLKSIIIENCGEFKPGEPWNINENDGTPDVYPPWPSDLDNEVSEPEIKIMVNNINLSGNFFYQKGQFLESEKKYKKALRYLDWYTTNHKKKQQADFVTLKHLLLLNLTATRLNINKNKEALEHCNEILKANPNYGKAYYRRAKAKLGLKEYDSALNDLKKAYKIHPQDKHIKSLFDIIKTRRQIYSVKEKQFCLNAFKIFK